MKKQILFLSFLVLAVLAGVTNSYGQIKNPTPEVSLAPTCTASASNPAAGEEYIYTVEIPNTYSGYNGDGTYDWYVTQDANLLNLTVIITPGTDFTVDATGTGSTYHATGTTNETIEITWTAAAITNGNPYYLVIHYTEDNEDGTAGCSPDNIKVYVIEPQNTFWLNINPALADGTLPDISALTSYDLCPPVVESAQIVGTNVEYKFGEKILYAMIHAAGYTGTWQASLQLSNIMNDQAVTSVAWSSGASSGTFTAPGSIAYAAANNDGTVAGTWTADLPATVAGTDILVAITIDNEHHEGLADQIVKIAIDGSYNSGVYNDKSDATSACADEAAYADYVNETIKARPGVNPSNPASFMPSPTLQP